MTSLITTIKKRKSPEMKIEKDWIGNEVKKSDQNPESFEEIKIKKVI